VQRIIGCHFYMLGGTFYRYVSLSGNAVHQSTQQRREVQQIGRRDPFLSIPGVYLLLYSIKDTHRATS
jgi:hypothetical protein